MARFDLARLNLPWASSSPRRLSHFPKIILWAWERPEELRFIDPREVGVAFLARTIFLKGETIIVRPRLQPLSVPDQTALMAVVRIESDRFDPRVPEALHLAVKSTRFGCVDKETGKFSKAAFDLLHQRYPRSRWAEQTKYWYK